MRISDAIAICALGALAVDRGASLTRRPTPAEARHPYRVGVLNESAAANHPTVEGLKAGLRELGFEEGRDVTFDIRFTKGDPLATNAAAADLVNSKVDLLFTSNEAATQAAKDATKKVPIVFTLWEIQLPSESSRNSRNRAGTSQACRT